MLQADLYHDLDLYLYQQRSQLPELLTKSPVAVATTGIKLCRPTHYCHSCDLQGQDSAYFDKCVPHSQDETTERCRHTNMATQLYSISSYFMHRMQNNSAQSGKKKKNWNTSVFQTCSASSCWASSTHDSDNELIQDLDDRCHASTELSEQAGRNLGHPTIDQTDSHTRRPAFTVERFRFMRV